MRKRNIKRGHMYTTINSSIVECIEMGDPAKFKVVYPTPGVERYIEGRNIIRELSGREVAAFRQGQVEHGRKLKAKGA